MKYNQPYGVSDANAAYVNGNPTTGTPGSIPPAHSIEHPQREIVNHITNTGGTGFVPSATDLHQLSKAIQAGGVNYADDVGTPSLLRVTLTPAPPALRKGLHVYTIAKYNNYAAEGATTLELVPHAAKPVLHLDGSPLTPNELRAGTIALFVYDGNSWQWISAPFVPITTGTLQANLVLWVNSTTGVDTNDGLTASTAYRTIKRAIETVNRLNLNEKNITINVAAGTYPENVVLSPLSGNGTVYIHGNNGVEPPTAASNFATLTQIAPANGACIRWGELFPTNGWYLRGLHLTSPNNGANYGQGIMGGYGTVSMTYMSFGPCAHAHVSVGGGCRITIGGDQAGALPRATWLISGGADYHIYMSGHCELNNLQPDMIITNNPTFGIAFANASQLTVMNVRFFSISGTALGKRYAVHTNSIMNTGGMGVSYLPGNTAGTVDTGGQYT